MNQATKDFVRGMGQALDMGATIIAIRRTPPIRRSDAAALRSDWSKIGGDLSRAMTESASQASKPVRSK